jgi:TPR repeat protein
MQAFSEARYGWVLSYVRPFAEHGLADAQCMMGLLYQAGAGVEQDGTRALDWYAKAAAQNHAVAWNNLGTIFMTGLPGIPPDAAESSRCYEKANALGFTVMDINDLGR